MRVRVLAEAAEELEQAALWYEQESPDLGLRLIEAFENAVQLLREDCLLYTSPSPRDRG